jgi:hypothetical protein
VEVGSSRLSSPISTRALTIARPGSASSASAAQRSASACHAVSSSPKDVAAPRLAQPEVAPGGAQVLSGVVTCAGIDACGPLASAPRPTGIA